MNSFERDAVGRPETWSTTITSKLFLWLTVGMFVLTGLILFLMAGRGELSALGTGWVLLLSMLVLLAGVVVVAAFIRVHVSVDAGGLCVVYAFRGLPIKRIQAEQIQKVEATELNPAQWGGWGYRIMPGRSALTLRTGPGLVVTTTADKQSALSLDEPQVPAALFDSVRRDSSPGRNQ